MRPVVRVRYDARAARVSHIDHAGVVLIVGQVLQADELEDIVIIGPILERSLGRFIQSARGRSPSARG